MHPVESTEGHMTALTSFELVLLYRLTLGLKIDDLLAGDSRRKLVELKLIEDLNGTASLTEAGFDVWRNLRQLSARSPI